MRFGSISLLSLVGLMGMACGGGDGGAPVTTGSGTPGNGDASYQTPPSTYQPPTALNPRTYEPPPGSYDTPPGQTNAGGIGTGPSIGDVWTRVCNEVLALNCDFSNLDSGNDGNNGNGNGPSAVPSTMSSMSDAQACAQAGAALSTEIPCPSEFAAALSCILDNITLTCDLFSSAADNDSIDQNVAVTCQAPVLAFAQCEGATGATSPPPPANQCETPSCIACPGDCERCLCENSDAQYCNNICINH
jgi:hypothetical protein